MKVLDPSEPELLLPCQIEEAKLYWAYGESKMAKHLVRTLINTTKQVQIRWIIKQAILGVRVTKCHSLSSRHS